MRIFFLICIMSMKGLIHGGRVLECMKHFELCGENNCCCSRDKAVCNGTEEKLTYIPSLPERITSLKFSNNALPNVLKSTFRNISKLRLTELVIENDGITNLSTNAFIDLQFLKVLRFHGNTINTSQLFEAIGVINKTQLMTLDLTNISLNGQIPKAFIDVLNGSYLNNLLLKQVRIQIVDIADFANIRRLGFLDLSENNITYLNATSGHANIKSLKLTQNLIAGAPPEFCANEKNKFPNLEYLYLDNNLISIIGSEHIGCLTSLKRLVVSANVIKYIPANFIATLPYLYDLRVNQMCGLGGHNVAVNRYAFNSTSLKRLELGLNNMIFTKKYVEIDIFESCKELTYLNFQGNSLKKLSDEDITKIFSPLQKLESLFLAANHMRSIPKKMLMNFKYLRLLSLDGNGIQELGDSLLGPRNLKHLTVQGNNIRIVKPNSLPSSVLNTLRRLNLADNPFSCTCDNLWFRNWLGEDGKPKGSNITFDNWPGRYTCYTPSEWNEKQFSDYRPTKTSCSRHNIVLVTSITFGSILLIALIAVTVGIRYRWHMMYAWYRLTKRTKDPERRPLLAGLNSDSYIYVIYHDDDYEFVRNTLCNIVEVNFGMKLFVWHREGFTGSMANIMFNAIESCTNVIAVVSNNFVTDGWCEFQLDIGISKKNTTRQDCLTLILLENLDVNLLRRSWCVTLVKNATVNWCSNAETVQGKLCVEKLKARLTSL